MRTSSSSGAVVCLTRKLLDLTTCRHFKDLGIGLDMNDCKTVQHKFKVLGCLQGILDVHGHACLTCGLRAFARHHVDLMRQGCEDLTMSRTKAVHPNC